MIVRIICKGRYSLNGMIPCDFEHIGEWGDKELVEHQKFEKDQDNKQSWWTGFDVDKRFNKLKETYDHAKIQKATTSQEVNQSQEKQG